jgi:hypothetical protein
MTITAELREQIRQRANYACEYCGVSETDMGGELTVDHFRPLIHGGDDSPDNFIYCCTRCNQYKADYWQTRSDDPALWNPRREPFSNHLLELHDGTLYPLTPTGAFTLKRLRFNRAPLVAYRLRKRKQTEETRLLNRYRELVQVLEQLNAQLSALTEEQRQLLDEQRELLRVILRRRG